ncbi:MAG: RNA 2',3'-cyclic phosphodiesterase [Candidatus Omnitrophica bacterium]|nr:RNA 2',3'-cyclic phosphodiesterase [Candidatus Omnitrophota bacterium]
MQTLRSFIALEISPEIQKELGQIQDQLGKTGADVKWVKTTGIHLTLKFLGDVSLELLEEIKKVTKQLSEESKSFEMELSHLGAFPTISHPRVIWVGIEKGKEQAQQMAKILEERLQNFGFLPERRPFKAHLTLGRVRSARNRDQLKKPLESISVTKKTMRIEKLTLFKSTLTPQGALYEPLQEAKLA